MYAVGTFTKIRQGSSGTVYTRYNIVRFSATSPFTVSSWAPNVNGTVNAIAFNGTNCSTAYIGGKFTSVNGGSATNIAAISTTTGALVTTFAHSANGQVETIASHSGHLLAGGYFTSINGSSSHRYMASLGASTGKDDGFLNLNISGNYRYCNSSGTRCAAGNATRAYNQQLSHRGTLDLVEGDFTSVGGRPRQQIFMLNLSGIRATVTSWHPTDFNEHCSFSEPFYTRAASWSPDDSIIYTATTGFHLYNWNGSYPLTGICDTAAAFPATQTTVNHRWINYTGCDSLYSTAAGPATAYFGGHERWSQNPDGWASRRAAPSTPPASEGCHPRTGGLPSTRPEPAGSAPTTCCSPAPACGSPATTTTARTRAAVSPATPASASSRTNPSEPETAARQAGGRGVAGARQARQAEYVLDGPGGRVEGKEYAVAAAPCVLPDHE
jgi:hypothetical protein